MVGMQDNLSRYRLTKQRLLPKFGSKKNPFAPPAVAEPGVSTPAQPKTAPCFENKTGEPAAAANFKSVESISVQPAKTGTKADGATAVVPPREPVLANRNGQRDSAPPLAARSRKSALAGNWLKVAGLLSGLLERKPKTAGLRPARMPVQCELSLEKVKVVRNDLSDTDIEFRTARKPLPSVDPSSTGASPCPQAVVSSYPPFSRPALNSTRPEPTAWVRLTSRFFKAGQTQNH